MKKVKVLAGDFKPDGQWNRGVFLLHSTKPKKTTEVAPGASSWERGVAFFQNANAQAAPEKLPGASLVTVEVATEENVKHLGGTAGWATAGMLVLGPIGLLGGLLLGGKGKDVTFVAAFKDGRKMMATVDSKTYKEILASKGL